MTDPTLTGRSLLREQGKVQGFWSQEDLSRSRQTVMKVAKARGMVNNPTFINSSITLNV